jgi:hypothetical protein
LRNRFLILAALVCTLALPAAAHADPMRYGVSDDWPKSHPCGDVFWQSAKDIGYQDLRMTVKWDESQPTVIPGQPNIKAAIDCALLNNIRPILAVYPLHPTAVGSNDGQQQAFATFVALVGQAFPQVTNIIVGNEPNLNRFWQPQWVSGKDAAATDYEHTLAYSYDRLKTVRPDVTVWGPAISSRGNDNPNAASNPSHSPVWFIKYLGDAYRTSGRTKPIFDEFDMHPYPPIQDTDPFSKPFEWPQGGAVNLDRIKQALYDAFHGTGQGTPAEQAGGAIAHYAAGGLPMNLDEAGEQTVLTGHEGAYTSPPENVVPISEAAQATNHVELAEIAACDPDVKALLYFQLIDETVVSDGFQSGNMFADLAHKQSYDAVKGKIASAHGNCQGQPKTWAHTTQVIGAQPIFGGPGTPAGSRAPNRPAKQRAVQLSFTANEDTLYNVSLVRSGKTVGQPATGIAKAYFKPAVKLGGTTALPNGNYQYILTLTAVTTAGTPNVRTSRFTSNTFRVGSGGASHGRSAPISLAIIGDPDALFSDWSPTLQPGSGAVLLTYQQFVTLFAKGCGPVSQDVSGTLSFLPATSAFRVPQSAWVKLPVFKLPVSHAGAPLKLPVAKLPVGRFKMRVSLKGADGSAATITTPAFSVDAKGKLSFANAKPVKKRPKKK